jgi:hypothetical protein
VLAGTPILVSAALGDQRAGVRRDGKGHLWIAEPTWMSSARAVAHHERLALAAEGEGSATRSD